MATGKLNNIFADLLEKLASNIRSGNSNISEEEMDVITDIINKSTNYERELGTDEAIRFLNVSRNYFYDFVKERLKGTKRAGQKTIYYTKKELIEYKRKFMDHPENQYLF
jgi:archaellum biogenesis protein FlaJ (TadC family)